MMQLTLSQGESEIDLQAGPYRLVDGFYPQTASDTTQPIQDAPQLMVTGNSVPDILENISVLNRFFTEAKEHIQKPPYCYLNWGADQGLDTMRTQVYGGISVLDQGFNRRLKTLQALVTLSIMRAPWWEGEEEQIPLTNTYATDDLAGLQIDNAYDGTHQNFFDIQGEDIAGDLYGATRLEIVNDYASNRLYDVWIGQNWTRPAGLLPVLEGENSSVGSTGSDGDQSGGAYIYRTLPGSGELEIAHWTLSGDQMDGFAGNFYKALIRFWDGNPIFLNHFTEVRWKLRIVYQATILWESYWITMDPARFTLIRDVFQIRLPPWLPNQTDLAPIEIGLWATRDLGQPFEVAGPDMDVGIDYLYFMPVDGWRALSCIGYGIPENSRIVDDGINNDVYVDDGEGGNKIGIIAPSGSPIMVKGGADQRIHLLMHANLEYTSEIARTANVKLFYRPRWMNV